MSEKIEPETYLAIEGWYMGRRTGEREWKLWQSGDSIGSTVKAAKKTMARFQALWPDDPDFRSRLVRVTVNKELVV